MEEFTKKKSGEHTGPVIKPIVLSAPVQWRDEGGVEKTTEYEAESRGFCVKGLVKLIKKCKVGPEGREGTIKAFSKVKSDIWADVEFEEIEGEDSLPSEAGFTSALGYVRTCVRTQAFVVRLRYVLSYVFTSILTYYVSIVCHARNCSSTYVPYVRTHVLNCLTIQLSPAARGTRETGPSAGEHRGS